MGSHALQIEVNRALYLDEIRLRPTRRFARLRQDLAALAGQLFAEFGRRSDRRAAAE
jgi:N-formylglutamate amidohydrolase